MNETNQRSHSVMSPTFSPKLINVYRKMRSKTLDILSQDELNEVLKLF